MSAELNPFHFLLSWMPLRRWATVVIFQNFLSCVYVRPDDLYWAGYEAEWNKAQ